MEQVMPCKQWAVGAACTTYTIWCTITEKALTSHFQEMGMEVIRLNLGKKAGDILNVPLEALEKPIDFLVSGPPCPPWAGQGKRQGCKDPRSHVFMTVGVIILSSFIA